MKWEAQLNESVLSLCSYDEDDQCQVFAGLADGTMAVIEVRGREVAVRIRHLIAAISMIQ